MKNYFTLCFCVMLSLSASANYFAVKKCASLNQKAFLEECKANNYIVSDLRNEGYYLIETQDLNLETANCFVTKVNQIGGHIAFNTNQLLVQLKAGDSYQKTSLIKDYKLGNHPIIPNLYLLDSELENLEEIKILKNEISRNSVVKYVGFKQVFTLDAATNDLLYDRQWSIDNQGTSVQGNGTPDADMQVDSAWILSQGSSSIKIAILDSGVDTLHEDLISNILPGFDSYSTDSTDTKGFPTPNFSSDGHGTACAGIAAAEAGNGIGIAGIANLCKIIPIRIFYYQDYGGSIGVQATTNTDALISGPAHAWRVAEADIMSISAGLSPLFISALGVDQTLVNTEINEAYWSGRSGYGVLMFFSAGNDDFNDVLWPGDLPTTIAIGASTMCDERKNPNDCSTESWGSSYGLMLDVVAPGTRIAATDMTGSAGYANGPYTATFNGTSASCPNAAGVGALILSYSPGLHARDVKAILNLTADRVGGYGYDSTTVHGTWDLEMGHGRINAYKAVQLAQTYESTVGVGIKDLIQVDNFKVYPNPSNGNITIENLSSSTDVFYIYDVIGNEVGAISTYAIETSIDLELIPGMYMLKSEKSQVSLKLIVQ